MSRLIDLITQNYSEEIRYNNIKGQYKKSDKNARLSKGTFLVCKEISQYYISFEYDNGKELRVIANTRNLKIAIRTQNDFKYLYWISDVQDDVITVSFISIPNSQIVGKVEIGYGDDIISAYCRKPEDRKRVVNDLPKLLRDDLAFSGDDSSFYIFIQKYNNQSEGLSQVKLIGLNKYAYIDIKEGKWTINKIVNEQKFPKRYKFLDNIECYEIEPDIFKDQSEIAINANVALELYRSGEALLQLWSKYDDFELQEAKKFNEDFDEIEFEYVGRKEAINENDEDSSIVRLVVKEEDKVAKLCDNLDKICSKSFELVKHKTGEAIPQKARKRFKIQKIDTDSMYAYVCDPMGDIHGCGYFILSSQGEDRVSQRRKEVKNVFLSNNIKEPVVYNLKMAMEGLVDGMIKIPREHVKGVNESTRRFLAGPPCYINKLTEQQEKAIEMAINTPDIAIIQGPPGTGKTTIIAAICHRLSELAEKDREKDDNNNYVKTFLLSAFQNDTVEHIASKVRVNGIPTVKVGRDTQGKRSEDEYADELSDIIQKKLASLQAKYNVRRTSVKLADVKNRFLEHNNKNDAVFQIENLIKSDPLNQELKNDWEQINPTISKTHSSDKDKAEIIKAFKAIRTDEISYEDEGFENIRKLLRLNPPILPEEKDFLMNAPLDCDEVEDDFYEKLQAFKEKYLNILYTDEEVVSSGVDNDFLQWLDNAIEFYKNKEAKSYEDRDTFLTAVLEQIYDSISPTTGNKKYIREGIKNYAESLAATNQFSANREVSQANSYSNVILEEAARSNPLDLLIPAIKGSSRIIMVGDHKQLPQLLEPIVEGLTINSYDEEEQSSMEEKLKMSLFQVLYDNLEKLQTTSPDKPRRVIRLREQYRMHPVIGDFINRMYYGDLDSQYVSPASKAHGLSLPWAKDKVCVGWDVPGYSENKYKGISRKEEVTEIVKIIKDIWSDKASENLSIGVITFYRKQKELLNYAAQKEGWVTRNQDGEFVTSKAYEETEQGHKEKFRIGTVDGFQGKEFDIVIISTVRCNKIMYKKINNKKGEEISETIKARMAYGFLTLPNRLNVAFSRAQRLLITVGSKEMFTDDYAKKHVPGLYEFFTNMI